MADFIPSRLTDKVTYLADVDTKLTANPAGFGIDAPAALEFHNLYTAMAAAVAQQESADNDAKARTAAQHAATDAIVSAFRQLAQQFRADEAVTDETLAGIGLSRRSPTNRPVGAPADPPEFNLLALQIGVAIFSFRAAGIGGPRARAAGAVGVQISLADGSVAVVEGEADRGNVTFVSRTPGGVVTALGKPRLRAYARWQTARGLTSPWSTPIEFNPQ